MGFKGTLMLLALGVTAIVAYDEALVAVVHLTPHDIGKYNVTGEIKLTQSVPGGPVTVNGTLYGLTAGLHGFHVHQTGDLSNGCLSALGHFNPDNHSHGAPEDTVRHVGDLGNILADNNGISIVQITDNKISLTGRNSVLGRSIVIHADEDDLGKGNHQLSLTTGNAGDRVACGVIGILSPLDTWGSNSGGSIYWSSSKFLISLGIMTLLIQSIHFKDGN